jgi:hypothetical protein
LVEPKVSTPWSSLNLRWSLQVTIYKPNSWICSIISEVGIQLYFALSSGYFVTHSHHAHRVGLNNDDDVPNNFFR